MQPSCRRSAATPPRRWIGRRAKDEGRGHLDGPVLPDQDGQGGVIAATVTFRPRHRGAPVAVDIVARSEQRGWRITAEGLEGAVTAGLVSATFHRPGSPPDRVSCPRDDVVRVCTMNLYPVTDSRHDDYLPASWSRDDVATLNRATGGP
jgi:hypothetical protein